MLQGEKGFFFSAAAGQTLPVNIISGDPGSRVEQPVLPF